MRLIIAGGREFSDYVLLSWYANRFFREEYGDVTVISGAARGADSLGVRWAEEQDCAFVEFPAKWDEFGKRAGFIRNEEMANHADALLAFWDGKSKGTKHMIDTALQKHLHVVVVPYAVDS